MAWFAEHKPTSDDVDYLDRMLLIRHHNGWLELPRRPEVATGLPDGDRAGTWYLVRADHPQDAYNHVRRARAGNSLCTDSGPCDQCAADAVGFGTWQHVMAMLACLGVSTVARAAADVRVP